VDEEPESDEISLGYYRGSLDAVLTALERANVDGAVLELDGAPTDDIHDFAEAQTADRPDLLEKNLYARNGWFQNRWIKLGGGCLFVPSRREVIRGLLELSEHHAEPEIAIGLRVFDEHGTLVDAPDVGDNEIWVSPRLDADSVAAMRSVLADGLSEPDYS
jgi:hypothetical protein